MDRVVEKWSVMFEIVKIGIGRWVCGQILTLNAQGAHGCEFKHGLHVTLTSWRHHSATSYRIDQDYLLLSDRHDQLYLQPHVDSSDEQHKSILGRRNGVYCFSQTSYDYLALLE